MKASLVAVDIQPVVVGILELAGLDWGEVDMQTVVACTAAVVEKSLLEIVVGTPSAVPVVIVDT